MTQAVRVFKPLQPVSAGSNRSLGRYRFMTQSHDDAYSRDQDQKAGSPPRMAQEPAGAKGASRSSKTATDPASGEPNGKTAPPNRAKADQTDGAPKRR